MGKNKKEITVHDDVRHRFKMAGRPAAPLVICNNVIPRNVLRAVQCIPKDIYAEMSDDRRWLTWLAERRLIRNTSTCANCRGPMSLVRRAESPDAFSWKCRHCGTRTSIRTGSFFANCGLTTQTIVMMMYYWVYEVKATHVMMFESINNWHTTVNYNNFFRLECRNWFLNQHVQLGGFDFNGVSMYVEVDETYYFHRKYHRGRYRRGTWVVGVVERASGKCWLEVIARRNAATLERIISDHVLPGSIVVTDAWRGYTNVGTIQNGVYQHETVVHARNFVDVTDPDMHTQTIEGLWMHAKRKVRYQSGTSRALFTSYLHAFQWHYSHKRHVFGAYLHLLADNYNI